MTGTRADAPFPSSDPPVSEKRLTNDGQEEPGIPRFCGINRHYPHASGWRGRGFLLPPGLG